MSATNATENRLSTMGSRDPRGFCRALWCRAYLRRVGEEDDREEVVEAEDADAELRRAPARLDGNTR